MIKHTQTIRQLLPTNSLSVFNHFVGLALKGLKIVANYVLSMNYGRFSYNLKAFYLNILKLDIKPATKTIKMGRITIWI